MKEQIKKDMIVSMKEKNKGKLAVIRTIKSEIQNAEKNSKKELTDIEIITIIEKQIKLRKEGIEEFQKANREDLVDQYQKEIDILQVYMPKQLEQEEITKIIDEQIKKTNAKSMKDIGLVMKNLIPLLKGKADMKTVNKIIREKLG